MIYTCDRCGWQGEGADGCGTHQCMGTPELALHMPQVIEAKLEALRRAFESGTVRPLAIDPFPSPPYRPTPTDRDWSRHFGQPVGSIEAAGKKAQVYQLPKGTRQVVVITDQNSPTRMPLLHPPQTNDLKKYMACGMDQCRVPGCDEGMKLARQLAARAVAAWKRRQPRRGR